MEGIVEVDSYRRFNNYTNLLEEEYVFNVNVSNFDGGWSDQIAKLDILVEPTFWETTWFPVLAVLFLIALVLAYIRYRTSFLKRQNKKLEIQIEDLKRTIRELEEFQILIESQKVELENQNQQIASQRDEVIELNKQGNLLNHLRLGFYTNVAHEFRTPLTLIIDPLEQLMEKYKNDKNASNTLSIINRNAQRLLSLIDQLIYFRRIEAGKMQLNISSGDLVSFLREIFSSFSDLAEHQGIKYEFAGDCAERETWFDSEKIENVFYNLLSNAFKFTSFGGNIKMKVEFIDEASEKAIQTPFVAISVTDSGSGIDASHLSHIFEPFYQAERSKNGTYFNSSGIGLALTHDVVQALRGEIKVQSKPGEGSTFTVYIPYTKERFQLDEINENVLPANINIEGRVKVLSEHIIAREFNYEQERVNEENITKPTVLIVEDNFDLRSFLIQTLREKYLILSAENGKIGLKIAKKYTPELIISDVMMPVMDGLELCCQLKKTIQTSHIPVILLTAKNLVENSVEGLEFGADDYISKPFNLQILQVKMTNLIESRRKLKRMFVNPDQLYPIEGITNTVDKEFLAKVYEVLERNYAIPEFSASNFSSEMIMSHSLLYKKIRAITNMSITDLINSFKLKKAVELLRESNLSMSEIAFKVGFSDPKYFSRLFKKFYGMPPSDFS